MQQTFPAGREAKVMIAHVNGDLSVRSWDKQSIMIDTDGPVAELHQEGDTLVIGGCNDDIELQVPVDAEIRVTHLNGDGSIERVRRVELHDIGGDVDLEDIGTGGDIETIGEAIALTNIAAEVEVTNASSLRAQGRIGADASLTNVALIEIEAVDGDLTLERAETVVIGTVGGDLETEDVLDALSCGNVGGDCQVRGSAHAEVTVGNAGGDLTVSSASSVQVGSVGGTCELRDVQGTVEVGNVGGDAQFMGIGGDLQAGSIGGDAELTGLKGSVEVGSVGGDLELEAAFPPDSHARLNVGGDAGIALPDNPNLSIRAAVGGDVTGQAISFGGRGNFINLVYGDGTAHLELSVGGDLELRGSGNPRSSSASAAWGEFESEMADLGREMGRLGQEIGREIAGAFRDAGWAHGANWANEISRKVEEQVRRAQRQAERQARKAEERMRRADQRAARVRVHFNDREWRFDPERLERIKEQARKAAAEGVAGAFEAVERALGNLRVPTPPTPPRPTPPPTPPASPMPGQEQAVRTEAESAAQGEQTSQPAGEAVSPTEGVGPKPDLEQEREAILRMIAEGRISPEEGDMLLEGLGG